MFESDFQYARLLAEILRLQRWAGGHAIPADKIFGLMHGFKSVLREETDGWGITADLQDKVEDMLEDVEDGTQSTDGLAIKDRLDRDGLDETKASLIMRLCLLQSRFVEGVKKVASGRGSVFAHILLQSPPASDWFGALHYMELVDSTEGVQKPMHAVFSASVPHVGEIVEPQRGQRMQVIEVVYVAAKLGESENVPQAILIPYVSLKPLEDPDE
jgi:hypothetical protein